MMLGASLANVTFVRRATGPRLPACPWSETCRAAASSKSYRVARPHVRHMREERMPRGEALEEESYGIWRITFLYTTKFYTFRYVQTSLEAQPKHLPPTLAWRRGGQDTPLLRGCSRKNRLRFSAWRVPNTPWEVIMYVKATAKRTGTLI